jgi:16S rRNA (adenine1518-N6/adenine1519-N6)-dimethyltransferase
LRKKIKTVRAKKKLGQHFLKDINIAKSISETLTFENYNTVLEIGPGMGTLTDFLIPVTDDLNLIEIDKEAVEYLENKYPNLKSKIIEGDFLKLDLNQIFGNKLFAIIGNFPYNISTQIIFKTIEYRDQIPFFCGMFQKEVAERICESPGSKKYGIISVLTQLFYKTDLLFEVHPNVFNPVPKVYSAVIQLIRKNNTNLNCNEQLLFRIVKLSFQQRRKTLRNSLKNLNISEKLREDSIFDKRPEMLSGFDFVQIVKRIDNGNIPN